MADRMETRKAPTKDHISLRHFVEQFAKSYQRQRMTIETKITNRNPNPQINQRRNAVSQRFKKKSINTETVHTTKIREAGNGTSDKNGRNRSKKEKKKQKRKYRWLVFWLVDERRTTPTSGGCTCRVNPFPFKDAARLQGILVFKTVSFFPSSRPRTVLTHKRVDHFHLPKDNYLFHRQTISFITIINTLKTCYIFIVKHYTKIK